MEIKIIETNGAYSTQTVWSHTLPDTLYGALSGNVQKLNNGNYLINTIGNVSGAYSVEVTENHEIAWMCKYNYRRNFQPSIKNASKLEARIIKNASKINE